MIFERGRRVQPRQGHGEVHRQTLGALVFLADAPGLLQTLAEHGPGTIEVTQVDQPVGDPAQPVEPMHQARDVLAVQQGLFEELTLLRRGQVRRDVDESDIPAGPHARIGARLEDRRGIVDALEGDRLRQELPDVVRVGGGGELDLGQPLDRGMRVDPGRVPQHDVFIVIVAAGQDFRDDRRDQSVSQRLLFVDGQGPRQRAVRHGGPFIRARERDLDGP